jgi:hypothetical protein
MNGYTFQDHAPLDGLPECGPALSPAGEARRAQMLGAVQRQVRARGQRRRIAIGAAAAAPVLLVALAAAIWLSPPPPATRPLAENADPARPAPAHAAAERPPAETPVVPATSTSIPRLVAYVSNDPGVLERHRAATRQSRVELIDDAALLGALREAGLPAGIVRTPERMTLAFHAAESPDRTP